MVSTRRKLVAGLGTCIVLLATALAFLQWSAARSFDECHLRWMQAAYDQMAGKVIAQKATLTSQPRDLGDLVPPPFKASGMTNADGSVTIQFPGGEGGPRHGYLYHSGVLLSNVREIQTSAPTI